MSAGLEQRLTIDDPAVQKQLEAFIHWLDGEHSGKPGYNEKLAAGSGRRFHDGIKVPSSIHEGTITYDDQHYTTSRTEPQTGVDIIVLGPGTRSPSVAVRARTVSTEIDPQSGLPFVKNELVSAKLYAPNIGRRVEVRFAEKRSSETSPSLTGRTTPGRESHFKREEPPITTPEGLTVVFADFRAIATTRRGVLLGSSGPSR